MACIRIAPWIVIIAPAIIAADPETPVRAKLIGVHKIWDKAPHSAFTDLVEFRGAFYCAFREGLGHAGDIGKIRVLASADLETWRSVALLGIDGLDLRDAALSVTPDDRLMVLGGAQSNRDGARTTGTFASFSRDAKTFSDPAMVVEPGRWLWRVSWHREKGYGVAYGAPTDRDASSLHVTEDGAEYRTLVPRLLAEGGYPTEARIRFAHDDTAYCLHRRDGEGNSAYLGWSRPPYEHWEWRDTGRRFGGPNFIAVPESVIEGAGRHWIGAGRLYDGRHRTALTYIDVERKTMVPLFDLPSGGDTSYPGMLWHRGALWVSYYSSHEERASVYLAEIRVEARD